ncbi:MAG: hypothetical protein ABFS86_11680 [Planctomycetota bacterium]
MAEQDGRVRFEDVSRVQSIDLYRLVAQDRSILEARPESRISVDPRSGLRIVHSPAREGRPHDHPPAPPPPASGECIVCAGNTSAIVDVADLSEGKTFISLNQFPLVFPLMTPPFRELRGREPKGQGTGTHYLQWTSSVHEHDLHNMPVEDVAVVVARLAALEDTLYRGGEGMPEVRDGQHGHVGIVKNVGRLVGGSVEHGHQQIVHTNVRPLGLALDAEFLRRAREPFTAMLLRKNPESLSIGDVDGRFRLLVPWFMQRPLEMMIVCLDPDVRNLRDLDEAGRAALAGALRDASEAVTALMPGMGREVAWNLVVHNGIAGGLYVEILPYTQERGGYEALGMALCAGSPKTSAERLKSYLQQ